MRVSNPQYELWLVSAIGHLSTNFDIGLVFPHAGSAHIEIIRSQR